MGDAEKKTNPPEVAQVGGDHYSAQIQHWDVCENHDVGYLEGCATAYVTRYLKKGSPIQDLEKAVSFLKKMGGREARRVVPEGDLDAFATLNHLNGDQRLLCWYILGVGSPGTILQAIDHMTGLLRHMKNQEKRSLEAPA